jgi:hypothetical protein
MEIINLLTLIWVLFIFVVLFFLLPKKLFSPSTKTNFINKILSNGLYGFLVVLIAGNLLSRVNLFNLGTLLACYFAFPVFIFLVKQQKKIGSFRRYFFEKYLEILDLIEFNNFRGSIYNYLNDKKTSFFLLLKNILKTGESLPPATLLGASFFLIVFSFIFTVNFSQPLKEFRFTFVENYQTLLFTWQILLNEKTSSGINFLPSVNAALSTLAAVNPLEVVGFSSAILVCLTFLLTAITVWNLTGYKSLGLITFYLLGTNLLYLPKLDRVNINKLPNTLLENIISIFYENLSQNIFGGEYLLTLILLLLALNFYSFFIKEKKENNSQENLQNLIGFLVSLLLLSIKSPVLLLPTFFTILFINILPRLSLLVFSSSLITLLIIFELKKVGLQSSFLDFGDLKLIFPITVVLFCGVFGQVFIYCLRFLLKDYSELLIATVVVAVTINFLPKEFKASNQYLEYEISVRKTLEIAKNFPKKQWLIIAPLEELAISYGNGWYEDLDSFVKKYQEKVKEDDFKFLFPLDTFIFVEKKPFAFFKEEPKYVPFITLRDLSYKNYRSSVGRASLEQQAIMLCETYRGTHKEVKVYYEDEVLRIYFIPKYISGGEGN